MSSRIDKFRNQYEGASFAILGSSPTIGLFDYKEDYVMAVNGSVLCEGVNNVDFYLCGDKESPKRRWFKPSLDQSVSRIVATFVAPYDPSVLPNELERNGLQKILEEDEHHQNAGGGNIEFSPEYMQAAEPHGIFDYADIWEEEIKPEQKKLCRGGTITGVAAQMAMIMGAKELHLYGCSFGDTGNGHYGYDHKGEPGGILNTHPVVMDYILSKIRDYGVDIYAHGPTNLRVPRVLKK